MAVEVQLRPLLPPQTMYYYLFLFLRPCIIPQTLYYSSDPVLLLIPLPLNESNLRRPPPWTLIKDARAPFDSGDRQTPHFPLRSRGLLHL